MLVLMSDMGLPLSATLLSFEFPVSIAMKMEEFQLFVILYQSIGNHVLHAEISSELAFERKKNYAISFLAHLS